jgi:hypothetical protein
MFDWLPVGAVLAALNEATPAATPHSEVVADDVPVHPKKPRQKRLRHHWRDEPATEKQKDYLASFGIAVTEGLTKGQASDLIIVQRATQRL